jgi:hypothetical protein
MKHKRAGDQIVQSLLALSESRDHVTDCERYHIREDTAEKTAAGMPKIKSGSIRVRDDDSKRAFAESALPR